MDPEQQQQWLAPVERLNPGTDPVDDHGLVDSGQSKIKYQRLILDRQERTIHFGEESVPLTLVEFAILTHLAREPYWAFTREQLSRGLAEQNLPHDVAEIDTHIAGLREKLRPFSDYIQTVPYIGYRFKE